MPQLAVATLQTVIAMESTLTRLHRSASRAIGTPERVADRERESAEQPHREVARPNFPLDRLEHDAVDAAVDDVKDVADTSMSST